MKPNTKAILVTANGCCRPVSLDDIEDIYKYLGCQFFDVVRVTPDTDILIDDAGLINQRPMNMIASLLAMTKTGHGPPARSAGHPLSPEFVRLLVVLLRASARPLRRNITPKQSAPDARVTVQFRADAVMSA